MTASPFFFDRVAISGPFAYARTRDGRAWQTVDRGSTWSEVVAPPSARAGSYQEPRFCSAVGCDLSAWYRVGWSAAAPSAPSPVSVASAPPHVARVAKATVTCRPAGEPKITTLPRTELSPEDFGLGATRVPAGDDGKTEYVRATFVRTVSNPVHELEASSDRDYPAARAVVYGRELRSLSDDGAALARQLLGLRRHVTFVAPFDPLAAVRRATLTAGDVVAAARGIGLRAADVLTPDLLTVLAFVPVTSSDPSAPGDLAFLAEGGLLGVLRGSGATRVRVGPRLRSTDDVKLASAVALGGDEYAFLEVGENGASEVTKLGAAGVTSLFDLPPVVGPLSYPENPDALAVGPHGEVVVLRVRSGAEPPSALEPALVLGPLGVTTVLAPWSTLTAADDAACKADSAGYRATIQAVGAWVTVAGLDVRVHDDGVMSARVRWSSARVCLEGLEVRVDDTRVTVAQRASGGGSVSRDAATMTVQPVESIVVARFAGGASAARVGILPGVEARAPLTCSVGP